MTTGTGIAPEETRPSAVERLVSSVVLLAAAVPCVVAMAVVLLGFTGGAWNQAGGGWAFTGEVMRDLAFAVTPVAAAVVVYRRLRGRRKVSRVEAALPALAIGLCLSIPLVMLFAFMTII